MNLVNEKNTKSEELWAAIIAAISMFYEDNDGVVPLFKVKSIKKVNRR
jgi:hypothetical protein